MGTGEQGKNRWGTWHLGGLSGEGSRDKGGVLLPKHPPLPASSKAVQKDSLKGKARNGHEEGLKAPDLLGDLRW